MSRLKEVAQRAKKGLESAERFATHVNEKAIKPVVGAVTPPLSQAYHQTRQGLHVAGQRMDALEVKVEETLKPYVDAATRSRSTATQMKLAAAGGGLGASFLTAANLIDQSNIGLGFALGAAACVAFVAPNLRFDRISRQLDLFDENATKFSCGKHLDFPAYALSFALTFGGAAAGAYGLHSADLLPEDHILNRGQSEVIETNLSSDGPSGVR